MIKSSVLLFGLSIFLPRFLMVLALPFPSGSPLWPPSAPSFKPYPFREHNSTNNLVLNVNKRRGELFSSAFYNQIAHNFQNEAGHKVPSNKGDLDFVQNDLRRTDKHKEPPPMMPVAHPPPMMPAGHPPPMMAAGHPPPMMPPGHPPPMMPPGHPPPMMPPGHPPPMAGPMHPPGGAGAGQARPGAQAAAPGKPSFNANADVTDENVFLFIAIGIAAILAKARGTDITFFGPVVGRRSVVERQASNDEIAAEMLVRGLEMDAAAANQSNAVKSSCAQRAACEVPNNARLLMGVLGTVAWMAEIGLDWM